LKLIDGFLDKGRTRFHTDPQVDGTNISILQNYVSVKQSIKNARRDILAERAGRSARTIS
jgi:hypothetical protein